MSKEALVIVLAASRSKESIGDEERVSASGSDAIRTSSLLLREKMTFAPKDEVGIVLIGTLDQHSLSNGTDGKGHVEILSEIGAPTMTVFKQVAKLETSRVGAQFTSGLSVAADLLIRRVGAKKILKRIFLIVDDCKVDAGETEIREIVSVLEQNDIKLNVVSTSLGSAVYGENGMEVGVERGSALFSLVNELDERAALFSGQQALQMLSMFRSVSVLQRPLFRDYFVLSESVKIPVVGFAYVIKSKLPTMKKSVRGEPVTLQRTYHVIDDVSSEVPAEDRIKGYRYGRGLVPFNQVDEEVLNYRSGEKEMRLIGFTSRKKIARHILVGNTLCFVPRPDDEAASRAFSALAQAMEIVEAGAVVRYVRCRDARPMLGVLYPRISKSKQVLLFNQVAFAESVRQFQFASLSATCDLSSVQKSAATDLVCGLDLMKSGQTDVLEEGEEERKPKFTYNPVLHYYYECLHSKAANPGSIVLPGIDHKIKQSILPNERLFDNATKTFAHFRRVFPVDSTPEHKLKAREDRKDWKDHVSPLSQSSVAGEFEESGSRCIRTNTTPHERNDTSGPKQERKRQKRSSTVFKEENGRENGGLVASVTSVSPTEDFWRMLARTDEDLVVKAISELSDVIESLVVKSIRGNYFDRAISCIFALRKGCVENEEAEMFNAFLRRMRECHNPKFWELVRKADIKLISKAEVESSDVTAEDVRRFAAGEDGSSVLPLMVKDTDSVDDLLEMIE